MSHPLRPPHLPGEFDVAHLPNIIHLDTVERVTGVTGGGGGDAGSGGGDSSAHGTGSDSALHASTSEQASSAFWKGALYLTNYQLTFVVSEGANAGHFSLGFSDAASGSAGGESSGVSSPTAPLHPNHDSANLPLLHVPVGSIFKLEQSKYGAKPPVPAAASSGNKRDEDSSYAQANALAAAAAAAANSTLRDVEIQLTLTCRDARVLNFGIMRAGEKRSGATGSALLETSDERAYCVAEFYRLLKKHAFPKETRKLFAFAYMSAGKKASGLGGDGRNGALAATAISEVDGWSAYNAEREFARMGIGVHPADAARGISIVHPRRKAAWRLDTVSNARFELSPTYPQTFYLPAALTDKELGKVVKFRSKGRLPALVFSYSDLLDYAGLGLSPQHYPDTVILRAAQPNVGWTFGRCVADEHLLELAQVRVVIDARPLANAMANQAKGGGYENAEHYKQCRIEFMNIENIHVMRTSLEKLMDLLRTNHSNAYTSGSNSSGDEFWGMLQQSGWLKHVRILLEGAVVCANYIKNGTSILVHCSDGWDRTSQLTSLAQLILDPYYRTRTGFACLVEKEWLSFGHQFHKRCGHGFKDSADGTERSPIFFQFLDAVWQIMQQHPAAFEFNADYLASIADHLYSGRFGTFLHDNERLRTLDHVRTTTHSVWSEVNSERRREAFRNPLYGAGGVALPGMFGANPSMNLANLSGGELGRAAFLHVSADPRKIAIWPYWYRWERRKQNHAPVVIRQAAGAAAAAASAAGHSAGDAVTSVSAAHLHHTPVGHMMSFTLSALAAERSRQQALEQALAALDADAARLDAAMRALTVEANALRTAKGQAALPVPPSFRQVQGSQFASLARAPPPPPPARSGAAASGTGIGGSGGNAQGAIAAAAAARGAKVGTLRGMPPEYAAALAAQAQAATPPPASTGRRIATTNGPTSSPGSYGSRTHGSSLSRSSGGNPLDDDDDLDGLVPGPAPLPPSAGATSSAGGKDLSLLDALRTLDSHAGAGGSDAPSSSSGAGATGSAVPFPATANPNYRALPKALGAAIRAAPMGRGRSGRAVSPVPYTPGAGMGGTGAPTTGAAQRALSPPPMSRPPPERAVSPPPPAPGRAAAPARALSPTPRHDLPRPVATTATPSSQPQQAGTAPPLNAPNGAIPAAPPAPAIAPAGPPQFRISAAAFSGVKLKSTIAGGGGVMGGGGGGMPRWGQSTLTAAQMKEAAAAIKQENANAAAAAAAPAPSPLTTSNAPLQKSNSYVQPASNSPPNAPSPLAASASNAAASAAIAAAAVAKPKVTKPSGRAPTPPEEPPAIPPPPPEMDSDDEAPPPPAYPEDMA